VLLFVQVGEKLGKAEVEKRQAIDNEDYDKAKAKKQQMDEYRHLAYEKLRVNDLLDASMIPVSYVVVGLLQSSCT
jgi:centrosomal protein CEP104